MPVTDARRASPRPLGRGDLSLLLLSLIAQGPRHGYELIQQISDMFVRVYTPSPGSVYPLLAGFESQRWVSVEEDGGRKRYHITALGQAQLKQRHAEVEAAVLRVQQRSRAIAKANLPPPLREAMRQLTHALMLRHGHWQDANVGHITTLLNQATALVQQVTRAP